MQQSDSALVARARQGHGDAYRLLVERHTRNLFRLAYRMTGNEHDAEDVVQETMLRAFRQLHRYESRSSFSTWLYRIAANCSLDLIHHRRERREFKVLPGGDDEPTTDMVEQIAGDDPGPERLAYSTQVQQRVAAAMTELSPQERTAFVLRHFEGQSIDDISAALGVSGSAAKHSIFRAVQKLRRMLEPVVGRVSCNT
jgi:RNA polymerase sigma-70 factor (ECF subfamily)